MFAQDGAVAVEPRAEYRAIFEASSDGLVINDAESGIVLEANPAFCRMHGYEHMTGMYPSDFIHPASQHLFEEYVAAIRQGREYRCRAQDVRRDGSIFDVEVLGRGLSYQGRFALLGVVRDVSDQVRAYEDLEQRVAERTREVDRRRQVAEGLRDLLMTVNSTRTLDEILGEVLAQAGRLLGSDASAVYVPAPTSGQLLEVAASTGLDDDYVAAGAAMDAPVTGFAFARRRPVAIYDARRVVAHGAHESALEDRRSHLNATRVWCEYAERTGAGPLGAFAGHRAVLAVPLAARDITYGCLTLLYREPREFTHDEVWLATAFADQAALAIQNARLHAQSEERRLELEALYDADRTLHRSLRLSDVLAALVDAAMDLLQADCAGLWGPDPSLRKRMIPLESRGLSTEYLEETVRLTQDPAVMRFWWSQEIFAIADVSREHRIPPAQLAALKREGAGGLLSIPVRVDGEIFGSFTVGFRRPHVFDEREKRLLTALAQRAGLAIENARLHEESEQRRHELEALYEADQTLHRSLRLDDVLNALVDAAVSLVQGDGAVVWGPDPRQGGRSVPLAHRGVSLEYLRETSSINRDPAVRELWWGQSSALLVVEDVAHDPRLPPPQRAAIEREGFCALLNAHVRVGDHVFGTFGIGYRSPHTFSEAEKRLSTALAQRAGLAIQNARLHEESEQRWQELEALYRADEALHRSLRTDDVLQALADFALDVLRADKSSVAIWSESGEHVRIAAARGFGPEARAIAPAALEARAVRDRFAETEFIQAMTDDLPAGSELRTLYEREGIGSTLAATIRIAGDVFGAFAVHAAERRSFDAQEQRRLLALARRAGLAIQNARLYEQAQQAATLEERQRLARELHDAVTQTLFSTALMAEVIPELWTIDPAEAQLRLAELRRLTRGALAEMRTLLVELRPGALTELPLADLLRQLAEATEGRRRLGVVARAEGTPRALPGSVQVALYRTAQEALNNVVKHARAREAIVRLSYELDGEVRLRLSDDGCGFDPEAVPAGHLGVGIMRERAAAIGATFQLRSQPGAGTTIDVHWRPR